MPGDPVGGLLLEAYVPAMPVAQFNTRPVTQSHSTARHLSTCSIVTHALPAHTSDRQSLTQMSDGMTHRGLLPKARIYPSSPVSQRDDDRKWQAADQ